MMQEALEGQTSVLSAAQAADAISGFYAETTMNIQPAPLAPSKPSHLAQAIRTRRPRLLIASGLLVLFLLLIGSLVAALSLSNHTGGQSSASSTAPIATPESTPTVTHPATTCTVNDSADILNQSQICSTGNSPLTYSLVVNTSNNGDNFDSSQTPQRRPLWSILSPVRPIMGITRSRS